MCWKYVVSLSKEQKAQEYELFHQVSLETACFVMWTEGTHHQWTSTMSTFQESRKTAFIFSLTGMQSSCYPKGLKSGPRGWTIFSAQKKNNKWNATFIWGECENHQKLKVMRFLLGIWWMKQIFSGTKKPPNSYVTWTRDVADTDHWCWTRPINLCTAWSIRRRGSTSLFHLTAPTANVSVCNHSFMNKS